MCKYGPPLRLIEICTHVNPPLVIDRPVASGANTEQMFGVKVFHVIDNVCEREVCVEHGCSMSRGRCWWTSFQEHHSVKPCFAKRLSKLSQRPGPNSDKHMCCWALMIRYSITPMLCAATSAMRCTRQSRCEVVVLSSAPSTCSAFAMAPFLSPSAPSVTSV